ncbi:MAG TPA: mersacidin/lichenicidin family type 2 lantibiotic [Gemmatimonas aurantiaca]|uniref:Mersacidin/lichenicidin family type 2 lantibiotic n=1 Tax=Gemmatimonas aurantiaca TaxID=173480 RepID=A0A3D4VCW4_9BACT|nr:mersacidin/lichenicidin family type 2 lantibiotic [Gemmatimonas aurantiaca]HCT58976.1 mersacidin/lichenicidin family type 2 lantibiotic [Gemmatimonas aurantiaca]
MSPDFAVRAWKDPHFRDGLSEDARAALPDHPAGSMEGADAALGNLSARGGEASITGGFCWDQATKMLSVAGCDHTLWHGSCWASTIGCCPPAS